MLIAKREWFASGRDSSLRTLNHTVQSEMVIDGIQERNIKPALW